MESWKSLIPLSTDEMNLPSFQMERYKALDSVYTRKPPVIKIEEILQQAEREIADNSFKSGLSKNNLSKNDSSKSGPIIERKKKKSINRYSTDGSIQITLCTPFSI